jgi:peptide/nickel transport system ATP-binding protein
MNSLLVSGLSVVAAESRAEVVHPVDLTVDGGEILGLVGESGSGKTTLGLALLGYARRGLEISSGRIEIAGHDMTGLSREELRAVRGRRISYVPQDPSTALNPALTIGRQLLETVRAHGVGKTERERVERVKDTLGDVLLPSERAFLKRYPHQLSGGQQQRVVLAIAFACRPEIVVLDEPATGLDVTTQAHVIDTVRRMASTHGTAAIYITHDLAVVASLASSIAVMYAGSVIEQGPTGELFTEPAHPYTARLINAVPHLEGSVAIQGIPGRAPSPGRRPRGCAFAPRCVFSQPACTTALPALREITQAHFVRCIRAEEVRGPAPMAPLPAPLASRDQAAAVLSIQDLTAWYEHDDVLRSVQLELSRGECLALVGESGSGKTTLARVVAGLHQRYRGDVRINGTPVAPAARDRPKELRRRVQYIFQNPYSSLNPRQTVGDSIGRPLALTGISGREAAARIRESLELVALTAHYADRYPDQMSGGERQRVAIARALVAEPELLICDEVTSALDVSVQATIVELLGRLQRELGLSMLFVTHNLPLVRSIATRAAVMQQGTIVEVGPAGKLLHSPEAVYTRQLIANTPVLERLQLPAASQ